MHTVGCCIGYQHKVGFKNQSDKILILVLQNWKMMMEEEPKLVLV